MDAQIGSTLSTEMESRMGSTILNWVKNELQLDLESLKQLSLKDVKTLWDQEKQRRLEASMGIITSGFDEIPTPPSLFVKPIDS
jgi:hypothetical protein